MSWYHIEGTSLIKIIKFLKSEVIRQSFSIISSKMLTNSFTAFNILKKIIKTVESKSYVATNSHVVQTI